MGWGNNGLRTSRSDWSVGAAARGIWSPGPLPCQAARSLYTNTSHVSSSSPVSGHAVFPLQRYWRIK